VLFDAPTNWAWIDSRRVAARRGVNHFELIARRARRSAFVGRRQGKLSSYMFVAQRPKDPPRWQELLLPTAEEYIGYVQRAVARDGIGKDCPLLLWAWPPTEGFEQIHAALSPDLTVADIIDDERKFFPPGSPMHERVTKHHQDLFSYTDLVITHNVPLAERLRMFGVDAKLVLNATEVFGPGNSADSSRPRELRGLRGPIIGYSGTFSWRFDIELVDRLARERPDCQIVIVGSAHGAEDVLVLSRHPNVHFLGVKTYPDVIRYIRCFDVAIIPHVNDALSRSMNPLKAYLYASCGVPSVATDIANLADLGEAIRVTHSDDEFIEAVSETLELRRRGQLSVDPDALLAGETWEDRVQQIERLIDDAFDRRGEPLASAVLR
jgi:glycosyltransferase involved in cell wall biosynthesis